MARAKRRPVSVASASGVASIALSALGVLAAGAARGGEAHPDLREVAEGVLPSVVTLHISRTAEVPADLPPEIERFFSQEFRDEPPPGLEPFLRRYFREAHGSSGVGSGVIVDAEGLVATNAHVVEGASAVTAELASGARVPTEVVGVDPRSDVAVVRLSRQHDDLVYLIRGRRLIHLGAIASNPPRMNFAAKANPEPRSSFAAA